MFGDRKISVLKYAADFILCCKNKWKFSAGLNALYEVQVRGYEYSSDIITQFKQQ